MFAEVKIQFCGWWRMFVPATGAHTQTHQLEYTVQATVDHSVSHREFKLCRNKRSIQNNKHNFILYFSLIYVTRKWPPIEIWCAERV